MTQIMILPHPDICPTGTTIEVTKGVSICKNLLNHNILIEHACEMSCACATCHVIVRAGFESLKPAEEEEEDLLDKAWGLENHSRLSCQAIVNEEDLVIEIPLYSINHAKENN
ncbi:MAG: ISC system 2Fe-2S type ferredoxin [Neisseriales bacterium]|nr:MAG: ISC system 2Fe-2S type ferredoxin [Neisseriales bacterium]